jgi:cytosine/adenosine deaminase-related metal-dependent hydrolase
MDGCQSGYTLERGIVVSYGKKTCRGGLAVSGEKLLSAAGGRSFDLGEKSFVYPSLINTHDHLQGTYLPAVGPEKGEFYLTWQPWDKDLKASDTFRERSKLTREELYRISAYKCIFSGVTTVNDHFPQAINGPILPTLPIRAILEYGLAHEASSYDLQWGDGIEIEHKRAVENNWPFITHLSEGFDDEAMRGVEALEKRGVLDNHCLLVHCIGFSDEDIKKVAKAGASVSWCAFSNMLMFNVTAKIRKMLEAGINVTIGTDSSATGSVNLMAEMRYARELYRKMYGEDLPAKKIFEMVTVNAARAFWMADRVGTLEEGKLADLLVLKGRMDDPYENLVSASAGDIELLILAGKPLYGETRFMDLLGGSLPPDYSIITVGRRSMFIIGDPAALYREVRKRVGFKKVLDFLPFEPDLPSGEISGRIAGGRRVDNSLTG